MEDDFTEEQNNILAHFQEVTGIDSIETCHQYLRTHDWDVGRAINTALASTPDIPPSPTPIRFEPKPEVPPTTTTVVARQTPNLLVQFFRAPLSFLYTYYLKVQPYLPWKIFRVALSYFQSLFWRKPPKNPLEEIQGYHIYFNNRYGTNHSTFLCQTLSQTFRDAQRDVRLVFIYLHDKNSLLCDRFCREVLCGDVLPSIITNNIFWSASRDTQEGIQASRLLHVNAYPCFCIVVHHGSQQHVQLKLDGYNDPDECLAEIINAVQHADETLNYNREIKNRSDSRVRLVEEQNAAYLDSMRADQEKAEQRLREETERQKLEEDQRRLDEEKQKKIQEFAEYRHHLTETLPSEPPSTENDTIQVSIRLPADEPIRRRFKRTDPAKLLFEFAWTNPTVPDQFKLLWGYPRQGYQYDQIGDETIGDLMEGNTETCYLEEMDEDK